MSVWTDIQRVRIVDLDPRGRLKLSAIAQYFQDGAVRHAHKMQIHNADLQDRGVAWIMAHLFLTVSAAPSPDIDEEITVRTYPTGMHRLYARREFILMDGLHRRVASGLSYWLLINPQTRRLARDAAVIRSYEGHVEAGTIEHVIEKSPPREKWSARRELDVRYADIDVNNHANNTIYVEWVLESIPLDLLRSGAVQTFDISFLYETTYGQRVISESCPTDRAADRISYVHRLSVDGRDVARARTWWSVGE